MALKNIISPIDINHMYYQEVDFLNTKLIAYLEAINNNNKNQGQKIKKR